MDFSAFEVASAGQTAILLAVSGGSDSLALMYAVKDWLGTKTALAPSAVHVATIDHCLRAESAEEARCVQTLARGLGFSHQTLAWSGGRAQQALARKARLGLLAQAAQTVGAGQIWTGHTQDDVVETIWMRRGRGALPHHLAGPSFLSVHPIWPQGRGLSLVRPLISTRRSALRSYLADREVPWVEDPSNQNQNFERVRVRLHLADHPAIAAQEHANALTLMARRAEHAQKLAAVLNDPAAVQIERSGLVILQPAAVPGVLFEDVVSYLLRAASGGDRLADRRAIAGLKALEGRRTLGGAWVERRGDVLRFGRDPGEVRKEVANGLWDGRYAPCSTATDTLVEPFILRQSAPPDQMWQEVISARLQAEASVLRNAQVPAPLVPEPALTP